MIYAAMIAYNEEYLIGAAIHSVLEVVDKVVVIDGSPWGPSQDCTVEIAKSLGSKVKVISGTWASEVEQRNAYLQHMGRGDNNWCIKLDADEVWREDMLHQLLKHIIEAKHQTMLFRYRSYEFFKDGNTVELNSQYTLPNVLGTWRLAPGVQHRTYHQIGDGWHIWTDCVSPTTIVLPDVWFHHYGHAQSEERVREKHLIALRLGLKRSYGFEPWEEERYLKERWRSYWNPTKSARLRDFGRYTGQHPKEVCGLIEGAI
jgi:glycosyltransferase involved in cell wall biosynthesis